MHEVRMVIRMIGISDGVWEDSGCQRNCMRYPSGTLHL